MAIINPDNYKGLSVMEINSIQQVYIGDYNQVKEDLSVAAEEHNSGKSATAKARRKVATLVRKKLAILEDINTLGRIMDAMDGTVSA